MRQLLLMISLIFFLSGCIIPIQKTELSGQEQQQRKAWVAELEQYAIDLKFVYGKRTGWIDFSHAFPYHAEKNPQWTALNIWRQFQQEQGAGEDEFWDHILVENFCDQSFRPTKDDYFAITYGQSMGIKGINIVGIKNSYLIKKNLPNDIKEQVAYSIFMDVSYKFERLQGMPPYAFGPKIKSSSYSIEDLPSNVIGFFAITRGGATDKYGVWRYIKQHAQLVSAQEAKAIKENKGLKSGDFRYNKLPVPILLHDNINQKPLDIFYTPILAEGKYYINLEHIPRCKPKV